MSGSELRVATINLLNDASRWAERRTLLAAQIAPFDFDLIGLQEVARPNGESTAHQLAADLGGYSLHISPSSGPFRGREGIAILSRRPVLRHEILDLRTQGRTAQRVIIEAGSRPVAFANGHFLWLPGFHGERTRQVERVIAWMRSLPPETALIAGGDFNGTPESRAMVRMARDFRSAHVLRHGREPDFTCPTPLVSGGWLRSRLTTAALWLFSNRSDGGWRGVLDYLFVGPHLRVTECETFLDRPAPHDPTLYPSDHLGLRATLDVLS